MGDSVTFDCGPFVAERLQEWGLGEQDVFAGVFQQAIPPGVRPNELSLRLADGGREVQVCIHDPKIDLALFVRVRLDANGAVMMLAQVYHLPHEFQKQGIAKRFLAALYKYSCVHSVSSIRTFANEFRGAYAWARYGACPQHPDEVRKEILSRAQSYTSLGLWAPADRVLLARTLHVSNELDMMYRLSLLKFGSRHLGQDLLLGLSQFGALGWSALWVLDDDGHKTVIDRALDLA